MKVFILAVIVAAGLAGAAAYVLERFQTPSYVAFTTSGVRIDRAEALD